MNRKDFAIELEEHFLNCQNSLTEECSKHLLRDTDSRIAFASGYLGRDYPFIKTFFDVLLSGYDPDIPF